MALAGLVIGGVGLASLFSTYVDSFKLIDKACHYNDDSKIVITKFEVEEFRLLTWGESVGVLETDQIKRSKLLDQRYIQIRKVLHAIEGIFGNGQRLASRYGLRVSNRQQTSSTFMASDPSSLPQCFLRSHSRFRHQIKERIKAHSAKVGPLKKTRWAIQDRTKFATIIDDLKYLIDSLHYLTPNTKHQEITMMLEAILSTTDEHKRLLSRACRDSHRDWSDVLDRRNALIGRDLATMNLIPDRPYGLGKIFVIAADFGSTSSWTKDCLSRGYLDMLSAIGSSSLLGSQRVGTCLLDAFGDRDFDSWRADRDEDEARIYIYCAPCRHCLELASSFCQQHEYQGVRGFVRIDDSLATSCSTHEDFVSSKFSLIGGDFGKRRRRKKRRDLSKNLTFAKINFIDVAWAQQRAYPDEEENDDELFNLETYFDLHQDDSTCAGIAIIANPTTCRDLMRCRSIVRSTNPPREGDIFEIERLKNVTKRSKLWKPAHFGFLEGTRRDFPHSIYATEFDSVSDSYRSRDHPGRDFLVSIVSLGLLSAHFLS